MNNVLGKVLRALLLLFVIGPAAWGQPMEAGGGEAAEIDPAVLNEPVARRVMAVDPQTPEELLRAARVLIQLDRPEATRLLMQRVLGMNLAPDALADLVERYGVGWFGRLQIAPELKPEGARLAAAALEAFRARATDPARLSEAVTLLGDASPAQRRAALLRLRGGGRAALAMLTMALGDPAHANRYLAIQEALGTWGEEALGPLTAVLECDDPAWERRIAEVLYTIDSPLAALFLIGPAVWDDVDPAYRRVAGAVVARWFGDVPDEREAGRILFREARQRFQDSSNVTDVEAEADWWRWDAERDQLVITPTFGRLIDVARAEKFTAVARSLNPADPTIEQLHLTAMFELHVMQQGWDALFAASLEDVEPVWSAAVAAGPSQLSRVLSSAMRDGQTGAAVVAARILGQLGRAEVLHSLSGQPAPLAEALRNADERIRFAALEAIIRLDPVRPFAGSNRVRETLAYFAAWQGRPSALVLAANLTESRRLAGLLTAVGYRADVAETGRELFDFATASSDVELILIGTMRGPTRTALWLEDLRRDARTAGVPVGLVGDEETFDVARRLAEGDDLTHAVIRPQTPEAMAAQIGALRQAANLRLAMPRLREAFAVSSVQWLARLATVEHGLYDLRPLDGVLARSLYVSELREDAARTLAHLATAESQLALVNMASRRTQPIEAREVAASAFAESVAQFGILLTSDEILRQYDRYNASANADPPTKQLLGGILDTLEQSQTTQADTPKPTLGS